MTPIADYTQGTRIGRYTFVREIASGGMATVFLALVSDGGATREVAIKRLHPHLATEEDFVSMFFDEARLAARIRHRNVVETLEVDDVEGLSIVMEYIKGPTLLELARERARRGERLPLPVVVRIALDALAGLHAAHELADDLGAPLCIVHRDVSPHNILVGVDGVTRITDFGIAKASVRLSSTRDGQTKGKLAYMAPEQLASDGVDRRADVFAAGIVFWELCTGRRLFTGSSDARIMHALIQGEIPAGRSIVPDLPEALDAALMRALERDPDERWASCADFAAALARAMSPCAHGIVGTLASRAFEAPRANHDGPTTSTPTPPSDVRRVVRRERDLSLDATMAEPSLDDDGEPTRAVTLPPDVVDERTQVCDRQPSMTPAAPVPAAPAPAPTAPEARRIRPRLLVGVAAAALTMLALAAVLTRAPVTRAPPAAREAPALAAPSSAPSPPIAPIPPAPVAIAVDAPDASPAAEAPPAPAHAEVPRRTPPRARRPLAVPFARTRDGRLIIR